jgi:AbrB family looped-hinge helix DNA binding protein
MRISERGQITIPKSLRDRFGLNHNVEVEVAPAEGGVLIRKRTAAQHPVDSVYAILGDEGGTDDYIEDIRGR